MNRLIMINILENGINFDEFNARVNARKVHNKYETDYLKNKKNLKLMTRTKPVKNHNNKPIAIRNVRKLRW